jgi:hypothetical protein
MTRLEHLNVPPAETVRAKLAAATAEARFLRRLLRLAREQEEAARLRDSSKEAMQCDTEIMKN